MGRILEKEDVSNLSAVFDIDDNGDPIPIVIELYHKCQKKGMNMYILSARSTSIKGKTEKQLSLIPITGYRAIILMDHFIIEKGTFKMLSRTKIEEYNNPTSCNPPMLGMRIQISAADTIGMLAGPNNIPVTGIY